VARTSDLIRAALVAFVAACGAGHADDTPTPKPVMRIHPEYDFLASPSSTHSIYDDHRHDGPDEVAKVRAALRDDARAEVRRNAIVALTASAAERGMADYVAALDDPDPLVLAQAAAAVALYGVAYMGRPSDDAALRALRAHAPALRAALASADAAARYEAAAALATIADPGADLGLMLRDDSILVRREALRLARSREIAARDVALLDGVARNDSDAQLRADAVAVVIEQAPPELAAPVVIAALGRDDVSRGVAEAVGVRKLTAVVPAIVTHLRAVPKDTIWLDTLVGLHATCAAQAIASLLSDYTARGPAIEALRALSGLADGTADQLAAWAKTQPEDGCS
jgi:hypothetical protein